MPQLTPPWRGDVWFMAAVVSLSYSPEDVRRINRVRLYQQVVFLSDVLDAGGSTVDRRYLTRRPAEEAWSHFTFPTERPPAKDFRLWARAVFQIKTEWRHKEKIGRFVHRGHKVWAWRFDRGAHMLLHLKGDRMDVYTPAVNCWSRLAWDVQAEERGEICTVKERALGVMMLSSSAVLPPPPDRLVTLWEVLREWDCTWLWEDLAMIGDDHWIRDAIQAKSCIAVADGSYIKQIHPHLCSTAFIMECTEGRGQLRGSFAEGSLSANAYRGELLGLMAIHLICLAVQ